MLGFVLKLFVFTAYLTRDQIGLLTVMLDTANLAASVIPLGSQGIFVRFLPFFREEGAKKPKGLLSFGLTLASIGILIFTLLFLIFRESLADAYAEQAPLFSEYLFLLLPLVIVRVVYVVGQSYATALKKNVFPLFIKEILVRLLTGALIVGFAWQYYDLDGMMLLFVGIYFVSGAVMTMYLFNKGMFELSSPKKRFKEEKGMRGNMVKFGLFAVMTSTGTMIIANIDSIMITGFEGTTAMGIYAIAFFIGQIIEMPKRAISQITAPFVSEAYASNKIDVIESLYHKSSVNQFIVGAIILICVWTNIDNLLVIIPNGELYYSAKYVVLLIGLGKLFNMSMGVNMNIIQNSEHYRFNFYSMTLLAVLAISSNLIFIPLYGINGAAMASMLSLVIVNLARGVFLRVKMGIQPFKMNSVWAFVIAVGAYALASWLPQLDNAFLDMIYRSAITCIAYFTVLLLYGISEDLSNLFAKYTKKK